MSCTPIYGAFELPTTLEHDDETDSLAGFTFLSFGPSSRGGLYNSSIDVQVSTWSPLPASLGITHEDSSSEQREAGDNPTGRTSMDPSPSQVPLPLSPDDPPSPSEEARARLVDVERELNVARTELGSKEAELKEARELVKALRTQVH